MSLIPLIRALRPNPRASYLLFINLELKMSVDGLKLFVKSIYSTALKVSVFGVI